MNTGGGWVGGGGGGSLSTNDDLTASGVLSERTSIPVPLVVRRPPQAREVWGLIPDRALSVRWCV